MKSLAELDYDELLVRAAEAARLPALDGDDEDFAGIDVLDAEVRSGYGAVAVTSDGWLRERANAVLAGLPDPPRPVDALRTLDDETLQLVLFTAIYELCLENRHLRAFDPGQHKRWPKGHPLAGKFRPMVDLLKAAILDFDPKKDKHPFVNFKRPQLVKAAKDLGVKLDRGEHEDSIAAKLLAHLKGPTAKAPAAKAGPGLHEKRIRDAVAKLEPHPGGWVDLADLRDELPDIPRAELDAALKSLNRQTGITLVPENNQTGLTPRRRGSALTLGGQLKHHIAIQPTKKTPAAAKKASAAAVPKDGLDALDEYRLRSLAQEYDVIPNRQDTSKSRDEIIDALRALGALAPDVRFRRTDERKDLLERLKNLGRREPADDGPLERAVIALAEDTDRKTVAKQLRKEADGVASKEDADTLRFLASDLVRKKAGPPPYLNDRGRIDLVKLAEHHGADIRKWMPLDKPPNAGHPMLDYHRDNPFERYFRAFRENLGSPRKPTSRATAIREARDSLSDLRQSILDANAGIGIFAWDSRKSDRKHYIARGAEAAADLERLIDLAEAAKVPAAKRAPTLGATALGEIVPVDETRFTPRRLNVLSHRGESLPDSFAHKGSGTELVRNPHAPKRPGLSDAENRAMDLWTLGVVADGLNGSLRRGRNVHGEIKGPAGRIDLDETLRYVRSAIADSRLTEDTELWRGALVSKADFRRLVPGAVYTDLGLLATSTEELGARHTIAWRQSNGSIPPGRVPMLFKILAPAGTNAALGHERVKEVVLQDGQELRVVRVDESVSPPIAVMEVVPPQRDPGVVRGRSIVDDFDYDSATKGSSGSTFTKGIPDSWLGAIQKAQGFDGKPKVVTRQEMDEAVRDGATQVFRGVQPTDSKAAADLAEQFRSGDLYPGTGVYGNGTYASPQREVALKHGRGYEKDMLRMALRRDARVISIEDLNKLRSRTGITATASKMADDRQAELNRVDPKDSVAIKAIIEKYEKLAERQGSRSRIAQDLGRVAALLGYDAIYVPGDYKGPAAKYDDQTEYVILNRTAILVEEASP